MNRFTLPLIGFVALLTVSCAAQQIPTPFFHAVDTATAVKTLPNFSPDVGYNLLRVKDSTMLFYQYSWHEYVTKAAGAKGHVWIRNVGPGIFNIGPQDTLFIKGSGVTFTKTGTDTLLMTVAAGSGDITDVGPMYASGAAGTDGVITSGTTLFSIEGVTNNAFETNLILASADPSADVNITFPSATSTIVGHTSSVLDVAGLGLSVSGTTLIFDATELGNLTFGPGTDASVIYNWNLTAGDPQLTLGNGVFNISSGTLQQGGTAVVLQSRTVGTTSPLAGGGALSGDLTLSITANGIGPTQIDETANYTWTGKHDYTGAEILGASALPFEGATDDNIYTIFAFTDPTSSSKTITFPNASGTVAVSATSPVTLSAAGAIGLTQNAGTDVIADLEEETHVSEHQDGGADELSVTGLSGLLADVQKVGVRKNSTGTVFTRQQINLIEGSNITLTVADDAGTPEIDVTIAASSVSTSEPFITIGNTAGLSAERALTGTANEITVTDGGANGAATLSLPTDLTLAGKNLQTGILFVGEGATADNNETIFAIIDPTADRTIAFPNADGTIAVSATSPISVSSTTGNISLGTVGTGNGGTGLTSTPSNGQILIGNGSGYTLAVPTAGNYMDIPTGAGSLTFDFDPTEVGSVTWLDNADRTWTFDIASSGTNPTLTFSALKFTFTGDVDIKGSSAPGVLRLYEDNTVGTDAVKIQAASSSAGYTLTLPDAQGGASTYLQNNGSGTLSWASGTGAATSETYITVSNTAGLSAERALAAGNYLDISDGGANGSMTVLLDPTEMQTVTFGDNSGNIVWTFDNSGDDYIITAQSGFFRIQNNTADNEFVMIENVGSGTLGLAVDGPTTINNSLNVTGPATSQFDAAVDFLGATQFWNTLEISDNSGDTPKLRFEAQTGTIWNLYVTDSNDDFNIEANSTSTENVNVTNVGSGVANLTVEGDITEQGSNVPNATNNLSFFSATTSAQLLGVVSDETGSASGTPLAVFNQNPTLNGATLSGDLNAVVIEGANSKTLTESTPTSFVRVDVSAGSFVGGTIYYTIYANDGSNYQARSGSINFSIVNESADTETPGLGTVINESIAASAGTLTVAFTTDDSPTDGINIQANAVSSLSQTTLQIKYRVVISSGTATVTGL